MLIYNKTRRRVASDEFFHYDSDEAPISIHVISHDVFHKVILGGGFLWLLSFSKESNVKLLILLSSPALLELGDLIHFLGSKASFGYVILRAFRETIILRICVADADDVTYLIPIIIRVQTVE